MTYYFGVVMGNFLKPILFINYVIIKEIFTKKQHIKSNRKDVFFSDLLL